MFNKNSVTKVEFVDNLSYWALLALAALLPLAVYGLAEVPVAMTKILVAGIFVLLAGIFFSIAKMRHQEISIHKSRILMAAWGLPIAYLLSTLFASDISISFYGKQLTMDSAAFIFIGALALTLTSLILTDAKRALTMYITMLGSAAVLTLLELLIFFAQEGVAATGVILPSLSLFGTLNDLAVFFGLIMLFTLLSIALLPVSTMVRGILWAVLVASGFFLAAVNLTVLWWILGGFVLAIIVYSFYARFVDGRVVKGPLPVASIVVLLLCALFLFGSESITSSVAQWTNVGELDVRPSWATTVKLGREALDRHSIFGTGPDTFVEKWSRYMPAEINQTVFWRSDFAYGIGYIPTSVISTGLVGLLAWLAFFFFFMWHGVKSFFAARKVTRGDVVHYLRITSFVGALYLWIISVIQVPSPALVIYAFVLTGIFVAALSMGDDGTRQMRIVFQDNPKAGFIVTLTLTFVILASVGGIYSIANRHASDVAYRNAVRVVNEQGDINVSEGLLQTAIDRHPVDAYYRLMSGIDLVRLQQLLQTGQPPEAIRGEFQELLSRAVANAQQATIVGKRNYLNWENLGNIYQNIVPLGIEGSAESADAALNQVLELRPSSPNVYLAKAGLERQRGNSALSRENVEKAIALRPQYTDAIFLLAQIQLEEDSVDQAIRSVETITLFEPENPVAFFQLGLLKYGGNDFTGAVQAFERAVAINQFYANARYFLGLSYWRLGNTARALQSFEQVLETNPENTELPAMIENLKNGRDPYDTGTASEDIGALDKLPLDGADADDAAAQSTGVGEFAE